MNTLKILRDRTFSNLIARYVLAGGSASFLDVALLYILTDVFHFYYLASAAFTTTFSFLFRFFAQKYFAFRDSSTDKFHFQLLHYSFLYLGSLLATLGLLYLFVERLGLWYIAAQIITILIIASVSFFVYKIIIFKK